MRNGVGTIYRDNNILYQGEFEQGGKKGFGILYSRTGVPWFEGIFENNRGTINLKNNF